jgi:hypothetical protein
MIMASWPEDSRRSRQPGSLGGSARGPTSRRSSATSGPPPAHQICVRGKRATRSGSASRSGSSNVLSDWGRHHRADPGEIGFGGDAKETTDPARLRGIHAPPVAMPARLSPEGRDHQRPDVHQRLATADSPLPTRHHRLATARHERVEIHPLPDALRRLIRHAGADHRSVAVPQQDDVTQLLLADEARDVRMRPVMSSMWALSPTSGESRAARSPSPVSEGP